MFATAAWLVWVLSVQAGPPGVAAVLSGAVLLVLGLWTWERWRQRSARRRWLAAGAAGIAIVAAVMLGASITSAGGPMQPQRSSATKASALHPQPFTPQALRVARNQGRPVFVNMTAAWCITCLVNERVALSSSSVARAFNRRGVLYLKGDWSNRDPTITEYLAGFGRNGVPTYVYYPPGQAPQVLPQILTKAVILNILKAGAMSDEI
jgi:thiol:disulfide interchange protein DsbD